MTSILLIREHAEKINNLADIIGYGWSRLNSSAAPLVLVEELPVRPSNPLRYDPQFQNINLQARQCYMVSEEFPLQELTSH